MLAAAALLSGLGFWTYRAVESSLQEVRATTMKSLLDAQVNALRVLVREQIGNGARNARESGVKDALTLLAAARPGETGDLFAFDARGVLLTPSRFEANKQFSLPGARPDAREGIALEPYRSGRGAEVVGAWRAR